MKRLLFIIGMSVILTGCGQTAELERNINVFVDDVKEMNIGENEQMSNFMKRDIDSAREKHSDKLFKELEIEANIEDVEGYDEFIEKLRIMQGELKYKIEEIEMNETNTVAKVKVIFNYVNIGEEFESVLNNNLDKSVLRMSAGKEPETFVEDTLESLNSELDRINLEEKTVEEKSTITVKKAQDEWKIIEMDDELYNVISLGINDYLENSLNDKLEEVKDNKIFLEVESNFNTIFEELNKRISSVKDIKGKKLSKSLTKKLGIPIQIGDSNMKENVYYVFDKKGKVNIAIIVDDELYTIEKELKKKKKK